MKKFAFILMILTGLVFTNNSAFADYHESEGPGGQDMVATPDGGVIVLSGPKLAKYDAQLNLVKEIELKGSPKPMDIAEGTDAPPTQAESPIEPVDQEMDRAVEDLGNVPQSQEAGQ
jgi:hypothetical protein